MADTIEIIQGTATVVEIAGPTGPQGPSGSVGATGATGPQGVPGTGLEVLTTQGDLLYQGAATGERLPIGTTGQVLKVAGGVPTWANESGAVTSVNGQTGDVTLSAADVGAAAATHASTHHTGGTDALAAHQINGQTIFGTGSATHSTDQALAASRALQLTVSNTNASGINLTLPAQSDGTLNGDTYVVIGGGTLSGPIVVRRINLLSPLIYQTLATITATGQQYRFRASGGQTGEWTLVPVDTHTHPSTQITGLGTAATQDSTAFAPAIGIDPTAITGTAVVDSDARLSDSRTPSSHSSSHATGGSDPLAPSDIGLGSTDTVQFYALSLGLLSGDSGSIDFQTGAAEFQDENGGRVFAWSTTALDVGKPIAFTGANAATNAATTRTNLGLGDSATADIGTGSTEVAAGDHSHELDALASTGASEGDLPVAQGDGTVAWQNGTTWAGLNITPQDIGAAFDSHTHGNITNGGLVGTTANLPLKTGTGGIVEAGAFGTGAGEFAEGNHTHELTALDATGATNGHVLTADGAGGATFAAVSGGGVTGAAASASDVLGVSGSNITGVDAGSDKIVFWDDSASELTYLATVGPTFDGTTLRWPVELVIACSDESTSLTTGTAKVTFRAPYAFTLTGVRASVNTAPTGSTLIVDINNGANSALSTKLSIDASEKTSTTAATTAVIDTTYDDFSDDAEITIDIDQIGSTIAGKGLKVTLIGTRA